MTAKHAAVDDPWVLHRILAGADALLLDFDGLICSVFAGFPASVVAEQLREDLADGVRERLPPDVQQSDDPFDVLAFAATLSEDDSRFAEAALRAHEVEAVATAEPTLGAHDLIQKWHSEGRISAIVSNNSSAAVERYLHLHGLASSINFVSARTDSDPSLLKPNPHLLRQACDAIGVTAEKCALVGDSLTDIQAARYAHMPVIGYANKPGKIESFLPMEPSAIITDMASLLGVISS